MRNFFESLRRWLRSIFPGPSEPPDSGIGPVSIHSDASARSNEARSTMVRTVMWSLGSRQVRYAAVGLMVVMGVMVSVMVGDILWTDSERSSDEIRKVMIADSVSSYDGNCPCPYASDASGETLRSSKRIQPGWREFSFVLSN